MAWWLAYEELYGDMDKEYPIMSKDEKDVVTFGGTTVSGAAGNDTIEIKGNYDWGDDGFSITGNPIASDTIGLDFSSVGGADTVSFIGSHVRGGMGEDHISFNINPGLANTAYDDPKYFSYDFGDDPYPTVGSVDDVYKYHFPAVPSFKHAKPVPNLKDGSNQKYQEDKGIADLKSYVASTYKGHYTNKNSDVQTLDLIHSVGDAESFCRSNALKYLSRYDKKGQAKRDILKAMHYCLLLYYFSGNTQEPDTTNARYETF